MRTTLWLVRETEKARLYSKLPSGRRPTEKDMVWVPRSVIEEQIKMPIEPGELTPRCMVKIADWFAQKEGIE